MAKRAMPGGRRASTREGLAVDLFPTEAEQPTRLRDRLPAWLDGWGERLWDWRGVWTIAPAIALLVLGLRGAGLLQSLELALYDRMFRWRPLEPKDERIAIVGVNEADLQRSGWPLPDDELARLIQQLSAMEPRAIGLDFYRDLPEPPGTDLLEAVMRETPYLIGIEKKIGESSDAGVAPSEILAAAGRIGVNDVVGDRDGRQRLATLFLADEANLRPDGSISQLPSFGLLLSGLYLQAEGIAPSAAASGAMQLNDAVFRPFEANDGGYVRADANGYQVLLNYRGPSGSFDLVSLSDILDGQVAEALIRDRVVLIGPTAGSLNDYFLTPYSNELSGSPELMAGVEIHANVVSHVLSAALDGRPQFRVLADRWEWALTLTASVASATLCWVLRLRRTTLVALVALGGGLTVGAYVAFVQGWWMPLVPPFLALAGSATLTTGYIARLESSDRQQVMNLFGRHVTTEVAEAIWRDRDQFVADGRLPGRRVTATVLFTDLKNFSTTSEKFDPEALMVWLNEYMEAMTREVLDRQGIVDKFIGDAVMAVFGVPIPSQDYDEIEENARQAVRCALAMGESLDKLNRRWAAQGRPTTAMRVGIATGSVVVGSLGSAQRMDYTTIGDTVNVAARLESFDKSIDGGTCRILIESDTYALCQHEFECQSIGSVKLKGRQQQELVYQVISERSPSTP
ncbi:MAG: adenylate/guanylate cyclase domain-containing protein [Cyanobacteria bacterium J06639_1]